MSGEIRSRMKVWVVVVLVFGCAGSCECHDGLAAVGEHAEPLIPEHEMNALRSGVTEEELIAALPEWNESNDRFHEGRVEGAWWPASRLYEITSVVTVSAKREPTWSSAMAGYGLVVSRHGRVLRLRTEAGASADYIVIDDASRILDESAGGVSPELVPAIRAMRMTGVRPEQVILTDAALTIVTLGFNTMDVIVTHSVRVGRIEARISEAISADIRTPYD